MAVRKKVLMSLVALLLHGASSVWASSSSDELRAQREPSAATYKRQRLADALLDELLSDPLPIISNVPQNPTELIPYLGQACAKLINEGILAYVQKEQMNGASFFVYPYSKRLNPEAEYTYGDQHGKIKDLVDGTPAYTAVVQELVRRAVYEELFARFRLKVLDLQGHQTGSNSGVRQFPRRAFMNSLDDLPKTYAHMVQCYKTLQQAKRVHLVCFKGHESIQAYLEDDYESITSKRWQDQEGGEVRLRHLFSKERTTNSLKQNLKILKKDYTKTFEILDALKQSIKHGDKGLDTFKELLHLHKVKSAKWSNLAKDYAKAENFLGDELVLYETMSANLQNLLMLKSYEDIPAYRSPYVLPHQAIAHLIGEILSHRDNWKVFTRGSYGGSEWGRLLIDCWDPSQDNFSLFSTGLESFSGAQSLFIYQGSTLQQGLYVKDLNWREHALLLKSMLRQLLLLNARHELLEKNLRTLKLDQAQKNDPIVVRKDLSFEEKQVLLLLLNDFYGQQKTRLNSELESKIPELMTHTSGLCSAFDLDPAELWTLCKDADPLLKVVIPRLDGDGIEIAYGPDSLQGMISVIRKSDGGQQKGINPHLAHADLDWALNVTLNKIDLIEWLLKKTSVEYSYSSEQLKKDTLLAQRRVKEQRKALDDALWAEETKSKKSSKSQNAQKTQQPQPKPEAVKTSKAKEKTKDATTLASQPAAKLPAAPQAKAAPSAGPVESKQASSLTSKTPQEKAAKAQVSLPQHRDEEKMQAPLKPTSGEEESRPAPLPNFLTPTPQEVQQLDSLRQEISRWKQSYSQAMEEKNKAQQQLVLRDAELAEKTQRLDYTQKRLHSKTVRLDDIQKTVADQELALQQLKSQTQHQTSQFNAREAELTLKTEQVQSLEQQLQQKNAELQSTQLKLAQALESLRAAQAYGQYVRDLQEQNALLFDACRGTLAAHTDIVRVSKMVTGLDDQGLIQALKNMKTGKLKPADVMVREPEAPAESKAKKRKKRSAKDTGAANGSEVLTRKTVDEHQTLHSEPVVQAEQFSEPSK
ncbi:MAG: hypothetical protein ACK5O7_03825 [Holosporales bacterium]